MTTGYVLTGNDAAELRKLKAEVKVLRGKRHRQRMPSLRNSERSACVVKITSQCTGGGKYGGTIIEPPTSADCNSSNLNMPEGMTVGDNCLILNLPEGSTHDLTNNSYHTAVILGKTDDDTWVVAVDFSTTGCSATPSTFTALTNATYSAPNCTGTLTTYEVDWCAYTITAISSVQITIFTTDSCDTPPTTAGEFYSY